MLSKKLTPPKCITFLLSLYSSKICSERLKKCDDGTISSSSITPDSTFSKNHEIAPLTARPQPKFSSRNRVFNSQSQSIWDMTQSLHSLHFTWSFSLPTLGPSAATNSFLGLWALICRKVCFTRSGLLNIKYRMGVSNCAFIRL